MKNIFLLQIVTFVKDFASMEVVSECDGELHFEPWPFEVELDVDLPDLPDLPEFMVSFIYKQNFLPK